MAVNVATPDTQALATASPDHPQRTQRAAYFYLVPVVVSAIIFTLVPFFYTLYFSFTNWNRLRNFQDYDLVGFAQYRRVFETGSEFFPVLTWTVAFMLITTFFNVGGGIALALLLNYPHLRERNLYRTILIIPWALPFILLIQVWAGIFNSDGPINRILADIGVNGPVWLGNNSDVTAARTALIIANLWFSYPFFMTVGLAALQAIPRDLYEVADLDGAGSWSRFKDITYPFLLAAITPLLITQIAFQFNNAGVIVLFTKGLPRTDPGNESGATDTLASFAYKLIFTEGSYALAAAYSIITFFIIAALTIFNSIATRSFKEAD